MAAPVVTGVAALLKQVHPGITQGALKALVQETATKTECPPEWEPVDAIDQRERCYGKKGRTSFFGHGIVNAEVFLPDEEEPSEEEEMNCDDLEKSVCKETNGCKWDKKNNVCVSKDGLVGFVPYGYGANEATEGADAVKPPNSSGSAVPGTFFSVLASAAAVNYAFKLIGDEC